MALMDEGRRRGERERERERESKLEFSFRTLFFSRAIRSGANKNATIHHVAWMLY